MKNRILKLKNSKTFKNGFIYILGELLNKAIPFLILPVLTEYLSPYEYGIVSNYMVTVSLLYIMVTLSSSGYINVMFYRVSTVEISKLLSNVLGLFLLMALLALPLIFLFRETLQNILLVDYKWLYPLVVFSFSSAVNQVYSDLLRLKEKVWGFISFKIIQLLVNLSISLVLIISFHYTWEGRLIGVLIGYGSFALISLTLIAREYGVLFRFDKEKLIDILKFSLPLTPYSLQVWLRTGLDRYLIGILLGITLVGIYATGFQISSVVIVVTVAGAKFLEPHLMKKLSLLGSISDDNDKVIKIQITKTILFFSFSYLVLGILSMIAVTYLVPYFLNDRYIRSIEIIYWIMPAFIFEGINSIFTIFLVYYKRTFLLSKLTIIGAIIHVVLLFILINQKGLIGAAQAYFISVTCIMVGVGYFSNKVLKLPWKEALKM